MLQTLQDALNYLTQTPSWAIVAILFLLAFILWGMEAILLRRAEPEIDWTADVAPWPMDSHPHAGGNGAGVDGKDGALCTLYSHDAGSTS